MTLTRDAVVDAAVDLLGEVGLDTDPRERMGHDVVDLAGDVEALLGQTAAGMGIAFGRHGAFAFPDFPLQEPVVEDHRPG